MSNSKKLKLYFKNQNYNYKSWNYYCKNQNYYCKNGNYDCKHKIASVKVTWLPSPQTERASLTRRLSLEASWMTHLWNGARDDYIKMVSFTADSCYRIVCINFETEPEMTTVYTRV